MSTAYSSVIDSWYCLTYEKCWDQTKPNNGISLEIVRTHTHIVDGKVNHWLCILTGLSFLRFQVSAGQRWKANLIHSLEHLAMEKGCLLWNLPIYPHTSTSYFHFRYDVLPRHIVSVCFFHRLGLCFLQVCQSQGPCFKFIISCLKDEKPICLRGVWKAP